ncbi:MAG: hypothetical protein M3N98_07240 [Actinomycetota bacterium]|nr:hypothetical protein [Actinomycetota bacterium]
MPAAAIVTLIGTFIIVAALAVYLTTIVWILWDVSFTLGTVLIGVRSIAEQVEPVGSVVSGIAANVKAIDDALGGLLGQNLDQQQPERALHR